MLAIIAYFLYKIYNQREVEKNEAKAEAYRQKKELEEKELKEKYPHLLGNIQGVWLELFGKVYIEKDLPFLKAAFLIYLKESTQIDLSEGSFKWDALWDITEELLEHLEKYHKGNEHEFEIAVITYWQEAAEAVGELIKLNPEIEGSKLEVEPYTNIAKITSWFPKKEDHPAKEFLFIDEQTGAFPRKSEGSEAIKQRLKDLGL